MEAPLTTSTPSNRQLAETLFTRSGPAEWRCVLCDNSVAQSARKGYTNLRSHLWLKHRDSFLDEFARRQQPDNPPPAVGPSSASDTAAHNAIRASPDALAWLEWAVAENRDPAAAYCASPELTVPPLSERRQCLDATYGSLMAHIADELSQSTVLGLALDAWTREFGARKDAGAAITALYAVLPPSDASGGDHTQRKRSAPRRSLLLGLRVTPFSRLLTHGDEVPVGALVSLVNRASATFAIDLDRVAFFVGDPHIVREVQEKLKGHNGLWGDVPVIACANQRLETAANELVWSHRETEPSRSDVPAARAALEASLELPWAVQQRMAALSPSITDVLSTIRLSMLLPSQHVRLSWVNVLQIVSKYLELHAAVTAVVSSREADVELCEHLEQLRVPNESLARLQTLRAELTDLASVKHKLSLRSGAPFHLVRRLFDAVRDRFECCASAVAASSTPGVESGVVKVLMDHEQSLTAEEQHEMARLLLDRAGADSGDERHEEDQELSFADAAILEMADGRELRRQTKYMDLRWVPSTADDRAALFPTDGSGDSALCMSPRTAEMLTMLRYNRDQWVATKGGADGRKKRRASTAASDGGKRRCNVSADL